ncbi:MAG: iron-containing alcohol dehydrogenase [Tannerella sp.]|jgi:alcohol dehydrogenase class IV|nr:iron-containing alcohol dehydrogenase [Tannerella sp.]
MKSITLLQPPKIVFGTGCLSQFAEDYLKLGLKKLFILTAPPIRPLIEPVINTLENNGTDVCIYDKIIQEPTVDDFNHILTTARNFQADSIAGIGGGSVLDVAKLVAVLLESDQQVEDLFGTGLVKSRNRWIACIPTTAGTGSEVSPNAILLNEKDKLKKGIVSPYLVADAVYADPQLTATVPPKITAETGIDALTHCIEAYTNKHVHPVIDLYALEGIRLIASHLLNAVQNGNNMEAREALLLGSLYGGMCLGPVNTAAVHALSYPLGGEFHISHGLANSILLPPVMRFNVSANVEKYAQVALACGVTAGANKLETAEKGVRFIEKLAADCGIPSKLSAIGIPRETIENLAKAGIGVTRLLNNNPREVTYEDAKNIYESLF